MKKCVLALMLFITLSPLAFAGDICTSSGLLSADTFLSKSASFGQCLCGVILIPAAADSTLVIYDNNAAASSGLVIYQGGATANGLPTGFPPGGDCIGAVKGAFMDISGAGAQMLIWTK